MFSFRGRTRRLAYYFGSMLATGVLFGSIILSVLVTMLVMRQLGVW